MAHGWRSGSDEQLIWLLARGYQTIAKGTSNRRAEALARLFQRLVAEPDLLDRLRDGITKVKTVEDEVDELEDIYFQLYSK
ncbi:MAG: hypothetical protein AB1649_18150 [Chloroflexota bacterium]